MDGDAVSNIEVRNNMYVNSQFSNNPSNSGVTSSHNFYYNNTGSFVPTGEIGQQNGTSNPFLNAPAADFRLKGPTLAGFKLDGTYSTDALGVLRGADGLWDRGAFEFGGKPLPKTPTNFKVTPQ